MEMNRVATAIGRALYPDPADLPPPSRAVYRTSAVFLVLAFAASEWANIEATRLANDGEWIAAAIGIGAWAPIAVIGSTALIELGGFRRVVGLPKVAAILGATTILGVTVWVSYWKQVEVVHHYGFDDIAHVLPLSVDGFAAIAGAAFYSNRPTRKRPPARKRAAATATRTATPKAPAAPAAPKVAARGHGPEVVKRAAELRSGGMTQVAVARELGIGEKTVRRWETDGMLARTGPATNGHGPD